MDCSLQTPGIGKKKKKVRSKPHQNRLLKISISKSLFYNHDTLGEK